MKMHKKILTIAGSALIVLSTVQFAAAASEQQTRTHHRAAANAQYRNSNAYAAPAYVAVQPEWSGGYYSGGYSAPAGR
jgi:hypothetical protein